MDLQDSKKRNNVFFEGSGNIQLQKNKENKTASSMEVVGRFLYSRSPAESYHWPPFSLDILSCVRRRTHSSGVVWKNKTGSFLTLHHSQLISSDASRLTFSLWSGSAPTHKDTTTLMQWHFYVLRPGTLADSEQSAVRRRAQFYLWSQQI